MRGNSTDDSEAIADADSSLRSTSRLFPEGLARMIVRPDEQIRRTHWGETQVAARARRLDRVLYIRIARRGYRLLHIEWTLRLNASVRERTAEYHFILAKAARLDMRRRRRRGKRALRVSVESIVVVLSGRKKPWKAFGRYQTSPKGKRFTGVRFRIEPVYQRMVAELEAKGSIFWLVFVPLAIDADEQQIQRIIAKIRTEATAEIFSEIVATMLSIAQLKKDRPEFGEVIQSAAQKEDAVRHPWFVDGRIEGLVEGRKEGREEGLAPLILLFERRLGRDLTTSQRRRIGTRLLKDGPEKLATIVLDYSRKELVTWLEPRRATPKRRAA